MIKLLLLFVLFFSSLYANKVIYLNYEKTPQRVIQGEIFPITLKALSTVREFDDIHYEFSNLSGLKVLTETPLRVEKGKYFYDTFYLESTDNEAKLPDINATLVASQEYNATYISGKKLNIITLNPKKNFSNVIAKDFELLKYKTTTFDTEHNIIVFVASAKQSDLSKMHFENVYKQGVESLSNDYNISRITYYLIVDKQKELFSFSYFNLDKNSFVDITIPIVVVDDSVTTQSDLKPKNQSKERVKMSIAAFIAVMAFILMVWRRKYIYTIFIIIPLLYIFYFAFPQQEVCVKKDAAIRILPVENGIVFETTKRDTTLVKEGAVQNFIKVQLKNERIGWVRDEDICSN